MEARMPPAGLHPLLADLDWQQQEDEALTLLQSLVRFDTTNPPGNEAPCAAFLADWLRDGGVEPEVLDAAPGRANLIARVRGDGVKPPLMLSAHLDVVLAEGEHWTHPPFAGEVHDGELWGRGTLDMKNMAAMSAAVLRLLAATGARSDRDVVFTAVADEEDGCAHGSAWLVDHHPDAVRAEYVLGEVGGFSMGVGGRTVYPVQVAEKGNCWIRATARGRPGHASVPHGDNAVVTLARALAALGRPGALPLHVSPAVERLVRALADLHPQPARALLPLVLRRGLSGLVLAGMPDSGLTGVLRALVRNTATPTVLRAGSKTNVIPSVATAELDGRVALGSSAAELVAEIRAMVGDRVDLEVLRSAPPTETSPDTDLFATIAATVADHHPDAVTVPNVLTGFTDAKYWSALGARCYGFNPVRFDPAAGLRFFELFHGHDERIPVDGFAFGLRLLADTVFRFCVPEASPAV